MQGADMSTVQGFKHQVGGQLVTFLQMEIIERLIFCYNAKRPDGPNTIMMQRLYHEFAKFVDNIECTKKRGAEEDPESDEVQTKRHKTLLDIADRADTSYKHVMADFKNFERMHAASPCYNDMLELLQAKIHEATQLAKLSCHMLKSAIDSSTIQQ
jgi:hypothetical protein